jgi:cellulose synthase (UDP-forming)
VSSTYLPAPPDDQEKYWFIGSQQRWLLAVQALVFGAVTLSIIRFSMRTSYIFILPVVIFGLAFFTSLITSVLTQRVTRRSHIEKVAGWRPVHYPSVDVFVSTAGEPLSLLENTFRHVAQLDWPGPLKCFVLDDSGSDLVRALAHRHGLEYLSRPDRGHLKKAGNLIYGYDHSDGDFITILDADFVPRTDYLRELVPYFDDPTTGIVQSTQFFDTDKSLSWLQRSAGAQQELFYRIIQVSRDRVRASICVGSCGVYRRSALEANGGFARIGHSEDIHTGIQLLKLGYHQQYVAINVAKGTCPENMAAYVNQQYRWCNGSMSLMLDRGFHEASQLSVIQRICFWAGFLYYISTAVNILFGIIPSLVMEYVYPERVRPLNSIWMVSVVLLWLVVMPLASRSTWRLTVLRVQSLYSFAHVVSIFHSFTGRTQEWVATGAKDHAKLSLSTSVLRLAKGWIGASELLLWVGLVHDVAVYGIGNFWAMVCLQFVLSAVTVPLLLAETRLERLVPSIRRVGASVSLAAPAEQAKVAA